ncbi:hypothetical protein [Nonomuraea jabiensis]|uniref:hypothetical protein n=1 Tax=Nonomuraea jabiensis TaxID=882448 RepID=UPI003D72B26A
MARHGGERMVDGVGADGAELAQFSARRRAILSAVLSMAVVMGDPSRPRVKVGV